LCCYFLIERYLTSFEDKAAAERALVVERSSEGVGYHHHHS